MTLFFHRKTALFGLLLLLFVVTFSCGQFYLGDHNGTFGIEAIGCSIVTSTSSLFSSKESLLLIGMLLLLVALISFARRFSRQEKSYTLDSTEQSVVNIFKQIKTIPNQMREAFRKGIVHSQIYNNATVSS